MDFEEMQKNYPGFKWSFEDGKITLFEGDYILKENLIIPEVGEFIIDEGVRISIDANKSIISYATVKIKGSKDKNVIIKAIDNSKPFGTFAIAGSGQNSGQSSINWLDLSGGNERWINGMHFLSQLSIHHMDLVINNSIIHGGSSDDGMNIRYSDVSIENSKFLDNFADQVDLDYVTGVVKNSEFAAKRGSDYNGDGMDISGSKIIVKNSIFRYASDKGISIGEGSKAIVYHNNITNNNIGIAVKDLSEAHLVENKFNGNSIALDVYQKKPLFGGGIAYDYKNKFVLNNKNFVKDEKSALYNIKTTNEKYKRLIKVIEEDSPYILFEGQNGK